MINVNINRIEKKVYFIYGFFKCLNNKGKGGRGMDDEGNFY